MQKINGTFVETFLYKRNIYLLTTSTVVQREFSVLKKIHDNYPKYVLSLDSAFGHDLDGIKRLNIVDFLVQPALLKA